MHHKFRFVGHAIQQRRHFIERFKYRYNGLACEKWSLSAWLQRKIKIVNLVVEKDQNYISIGN